MRKRPIFGASGAVALLLACGGQKPQPALPARDPVCMEAETREKAGDPGASDLREDCRVRAEFRAFADARGACTRSDECSMVAADCPLNMAVAVAWGRADEVVALRDKLVHAAAGSGSCSSTPGVGYPPTASCVNGRCELREVTLQNGW